MAGTVGWKSAWKFGWHVHFIVEVRGEIRCVNNWVRGVKIYSYTQLLSIGNASCSKIRSAGLKLMLKPEPERIVAETSPWDKKKST